MASDLISREALIQELKEDVEFESPTSNQCVNSAMSSAFRIAIKRVKASPAVDAEPVRHGEWKKENSRAKSYLRLCSACGKIAYFCGAW